MLIAVLVTSVAVVILLDAHRREHRPTQLAAKAVASATFVVYGVLSWSSGSTLGSWILAGLVLGALGDLLLQLDGFFDAGLGAFLLGHIAYIAGFAGIVPVSRWSPWVAGGTLVAVVLVLTWLWPHLGSRRIPVAAYALVISVMVTAACSAAIADAVPAVTAIGAILFYLSDLGVARQRFLEPGLVNRIFGLPLYYAGQLILAWTISAV